MVCADVRGLTMLEYFQLREDVKEHARLCVLLMEKTLLRRSILDRTLKQSIDMRINSGYIRKYHIELLKLEKWEKSTVLLERIISSNLMMFNESGDCYSFTDKKFYKG